MKDWPLVAAIPPLLVWFGVFLYLAKVDRRLKALESRREPGE